MIMNRNKEVSLERQIDFKKITIIMIIGALLLTLSLIPVTVYGSTGDTGSGTFDDPFRIHTAGDLKKIGDGVSGWELDSHYLLMNDIVTPSGYDHVIPYGGGDPELLGNIAFTGVFDGGGKLVTLNIHLPGADAVGLFGFIGAGGVVKNLGIDGNITGNEDVGAIAGKNSGIIENCHTRGNVTGSKSVGGIVGRNLGGTITSSFTSARVNGNEFVGGITGVSDNGIVKDCFTHNTVTGNESVGGIAGMNAGSGSVIENCYTTGRISGNDRTGGVVGRNDSGAAVKNCAALVRAIVGGSGAGRVAGDSGGQLINNYARIDMDLSPSIAVDGASDPNDENGGNINLLNPLAYNQGFFEALGFDFSHIWAWGTDQFPRLRNTSASVVRTNSVSFDAGGGLPVPETQHVINGRTAKMPETSPVKEGFEFDGWYAANESAVPYDFDMPFFVPILLYAKWTGGDVTCENCGSGTCDGSCPPKSGGGSSGGTGGGGSGSSGGTGGSGSGGGSSGGNTGGNNTAPTVRIDKDEEIPLTGGTVMNAPVVKIQNYDYIKLRDFAMLLNETSEQIGVVFNEKTKTVSITTGEPYVPLGDELEKLSEPVDAIGSPHYIVLDGVPVHLSAYLIEGYNYLRLQDLASLFDVAIEHDHTNHTVTISIK